MALSDTKATGQKLIIKRSDNMDRAMYIGGRFYKTIGALQYTYIFPE
jgi:hypothetical protein